MVENSYAPKRKFAKIGLISGAVFALSALSATGASANRCGYQYPVDSPTTMSKVARACNVALSALKEANPGVNPNNVRPGQHLALPDEGPLSIVPGYVDTSSDASDNQSSASHNNDAVRVITDDVGLNSDPYFYREVSAREAQRIRIRQEQERYNTPIWLRDEPTGGHYSVSQRLSYQQQSAMRIRTASLAPTRNVAYLAPIYEDGADNSHVLPARFTRSSEIVVTTTHPKFLELNPSIVNEVAMSKSFSLAGTVIDASENCLTLKTLNDDVWRLRAPQQTRDLVGKTITAWGEPAHSNGECGGGLTFDVSHAVFAEVWTPGR